ncbi:LOW QUALITY PROTEIN: hypothetical protein QYF61_006749 [Mycteria americana]|uniref:Uncharacterized protein n=1 Tax=Mycteria americana TaxID=33587 RepID=A0AAN7N120_MYCAM|nr:LOW QUALITY PROTEIN: hypothetical protein QYF61_006749 [Mycteria americana]
MALGSAWKNPMGYGLRDKKGPRYLADIQGSPPPSSGKTHPNKQEISRDSRRPAWMSQELLTKLRLKKEMYKRWKHREVTQEEYRATVQACRNSVRKAKADLELNLSRYGKGDKKDFYKYINSKRKATENVSLLLNGAGEPVTKKRLRYSTLALDLGEHLSTLDVQKSIRPGKFHIRVPRELADAIVRPISANFFHGN